MVAAMLTGCGALGSKDKRPTPQEPSPVGQAGANVADALKRVNQLMADGKLDDASVELKKAREAAPGDDRVKKTSADLATKLAQRADVLTYEGKLDLAFADLRAARELDPGNPQVKSSSVRLSQIFADRAARLLDGQKLGDAEGQAKNALELDPDNVTAKRIGKRVAQAYSLRAANQLDEGKEAEARVGLDSALKLDPANELANMLHRSIVDDPVKELGSKSFPYTVKSGDTLSRISEQFMKEQYRFYLLARYNGISVPRSLKVGQTIKVPGTKPPPAAEVRIREKATPPPPPIQPSQVEPDASRSAASAYEECKREWKIGDKERAYALCREASRVNPRDDKIRQDTEQLRQELIQSYDRKAREAYRRQDLDGCITLWDKSLELAPGNESAKNERERCVRLKREIENVGAR